MTKTNVNWRPRLTVDITEEQFQRAQRLINWGIRTELFSVILDDLLDAIEQEGPHVIGGLLARKIKLGDIVPEVDLKDKKKK